MSDEKFCLKWNDFAHIAAKSFNNLREEKDFFDVTLVSEDQVQFDSHKVVLSASSQFFKKILRLNTHNHPLLYLHGVHSTSLQFILDYVYQGEVKVFQEQINQFFNVASNLKITGLQESVKNEDLGEEFSYINDTKIETSVLNNEKIKMKNESAKNRNDVRSIVSSVNYDGNTDTNMEELLEKISEMTEKVNGIYTCKVCHKTASDKTKIGRHIESHIDGITLTCEFCGKKFR